MDSPGLLYTINPHSPRPVPASVGDFRHSTNATGVSGMVQLGDGLVAVSGGVHLPYSFQNNTMNLYIVSLQSNTIIDTIPVPGTMSMNGLAFLPGSRDKVVSADSNGRLLLIDLVKRQASVLLNDPETLGSAKCSSEILPVGINGLRSRGDYLYFTNSCLGSFARIKVSSGGCLGRVEHLATVSDPANGQLPDDFAFDPQGNAFVAVHPGSLVKVWPQTGETCLISGSTNPNNTIFQEPTSVAYAGHGESFYVSSGGPFTYGPNNTGGQIIEVCAS